MKRWFITGACFAVQACGAAAVPPPPSEEAKAAVPAAPGPAPTAPTEAETPAPDVVAEESAEVREPGLAACRIVEQRYDTPRGGGLRVRASEPPFAKLLAAPATLVLAQGTSPDAAVAVVDVPELVLRGVLRREDVHLHAASPTLLGGFAMPRSDTDLSFVVGENGAVRVKLDVSARFATPGVVEQSLACDELAASDRAYDARKHLSGGRRLTWARVPSGTSLSPEAGGVAAATFNSEEEVEVLERRATHARVLLDLGEFLAVGWVPNKALGRVAKPPSQLGVGYGTGHGTLGSRVQRYACVKDLPLYVYARGERTRVGTLRPRAVFHKAPGEAPGLVPLFLVSQGWLSTAADALLALDAADFEHCNPYR
ncbi:MAG: hypothetical protein R3B13_03740 [Polyangiaceae bacterium]